MEPIHLAALPYHCLGRRKNHQRQPRWLWYSRAVKTEGDVTFRAALAITSTSTQPWRLQAFRPQTRKTQFIPLRGGNFERCGWGSRRSCTHCRDRRVEGDHWALVMCCRHNRPVSTPSVCLLVLHSFYTTSWACIPLLCFSGTLLSEGVWDKTIDGGATPRKRHGKCRDRGPCAPKTTGPIAPPH